MLENLLITAIVVIALWILILGLFLIISRKQPDLRAQMKIVDEQLAQTERPGEKR
jgi:hypothetical protein